MLAAHLSWHLRAAIAPLTYTDLNRPTLQDPVTKVERSGTAQCKASTGKLANGDAACDVQGLLTHLATRTRNTVGIIGM